MGDVVPVGGCEVECGGCEATQFAGDVSVVVSPGAPYFAVLSEFAVLGGALAASLPGRDAEATDRSGGVYDSQFSAFVESEALSGVGRGHRAARSDIRVSCRDALVGGRRQEWCCRFSAAVPDASRAGRGLPRRRAFVNHLQEVLRECHSERRQFLAAITRIRRHTSWYFAGACRTVAHRLRASSDDGGRCDCGCGCGAGSGRRQRRAGRIGGDAARVVADAGTGDCAAGLAEQSAARREVLGDE